MAFRLPHSVLFMLAWLAAGAAYALDTSDIEQLMQDGRYAEAYDLAQSRSAEDIGDPDFDFLLGLSAIESGHADQAVFALERVVLTQPDNLRARLELARAHFLLNDYTTAREEFNIVLAANPPEDTRSNVALYLAEIDRREAALLTRTRAYIEVKAGSDSNANSATTANTLTLGNGDLISLDSTSRALRDRFMETNFGASVEHSLSKTRSLLTSVSGSNRNNFGSKDFDVRVLDFKGGMGFKVDQNQYKLQAEVQQVDVADKSYRQQITLNPEWSRVLDSNNQVTLFGQVGNQHYSDQPLRDASHKLAAGGWSHYMEGIKSTLSLSTYYGDERTHSTAGRYNGRKYYGLGAGLYWNPAPPHTVYLNWNGQHAAYKAPHPSFSRTRTDNYSVANLGWSWQADPKWQFSAEASHADNRSSIDAYAYSRTQFTVGARYDF